MSGTRKGSLNRRQFMVATAGGLGCLALGGVKEALARAQDSGKPMLTASELNNLIAKTAQDPEAYQKQAKAAKGDLYAFLNKNFELTEGQSFTLRYIGAANKDALDMAVDASAEIVTKMSESEEPIPSGWSPMTVTISGTATTDREATSKISYEQTGMAEGGGSTASSRVIVIVEYQAG